MMQEVVVFCIIVKAVRARYRVTFSTAINIKLSKLKLSAEAPRLVTLPLMADVLRMNVLRSSSNKPEKL